MSWTIAPIGRGSDLLYSQAGMPSLDLRFAESKTLVDYISNRNLITFFRASTGGTYTDSQGVIRNAVTNLLLRSEEFDNASWSKARCSITQNAIAAPNGSVTADLLIEDTSLNTHRLLATAATVAANSTVTFSVYFKSKERTQIQLYVDEVTGAGGASFSAFYSASGVSGSLATGVATYTSGSVQALGDGWYRAVITGTLAGGYTSYRCSLFPAVSGATSYQGDGTSGIYLWGAQLEQSPTVGEYVPTTSTINSAPRFDHDPTTGESLGLLVEESRTNLSTGSEDFSNTYWPQSTATRTNNNATSPNNTTTACLVTGAGTTFGGLVRKQTFVFSASTTYAISCFAKAGTHDHIGLRLTGSCISGNNYCRYNLATGVATAITPSAGTVVSVSMQPFPGGWYRCLLVYTTSASQPGTGDIVDIALVTSTGDVTYSGTGTAFIWGAQLEQGAFPTSYIPTTTSAATRAADVASISGSNYSSWANNTAFTIFTEAASASGAAYTGYVYTIGADFNNAATHYRQADFQPVARVRTASVDEYGAIGNGAIWTGTSRNRFALALSATSGRQASNGALTTGSDDTSIALPAMSSMSIGSLVGGLPLNGHIRRLTYWGQRLPNSALQAITQQ